MHIKLHRNDIIYAETSDRIINICTSEKTYASNMKLKELEDILSSDLFFTPHRSFLINLNHVKEYNKDNITMINSDKVLVSRLKYSDFRKRFLKYLTQC